MQSSINSCAVVSPPVQWCAGGIIERVDPGGCPLALALQGSSCQSETHNFKQLTTTSSHAMPARQPQSERGGGPELHHGPSR